MAFDGTTFDTTVDALTDPPTANLTFTGYAAGIFTFTLSSVIYSATVNINSITVNGFSNTKCILPSAESDNNISLLIIPPGTLSASQDGQTPMSCSTLRYKRVNSISVNGTTRTNGQTITVGDTLVTVVIDSTTCVLYPC